MRGKRQMLPVPTAIPSTLSSNAHLDENRCSDAFIQYLVVVGWEDARISHTQGEKRVSARDSLAGEVTLQKNSPMVLHVTRHYLQDCPQRYAMLTGYALLHVRFGWMTTEEQHIRTSERFEFFKQ